MKRLTRRSNLSQRLWGRAVHPLVLGLFCFFVFPTTACSDPGQRRLGPGEISHGIWINVEELARLPMTGPAWQGLRAVADQPPGVPNLSNQNEKNNIEVLAKALVFARTGEEKLREEVIAQCIGAMGTERGGRTLSLGRKLVTYVVAADLVGLPPDKDLVFKTWLRKTLTEVLDSRTLQSTHEGRPNNWGTHAGASRAAVAAYLGDKDELDRTARVFRGWLGDRSSYAGFRYGDLSWQCDPAIPVGINASGCMKGGHLIDGVLPDDQRRSGPFRWPPPRENYVYEALQGVLVEAVILHRAGYDTFNWEDKAILRAFRWLYDVAHFPATGDDTWQLPLVDYFYGTSFWDGSPVNPGKNMGWTDWTHGVRAPVRLSDASRMRILKASREIFDARNAELQGGVR